MIRILEKEFSFAGFDFPRYVYQVPGGIAGLRKKHSLRKSCGPYYTAPKPNSAGYSFYLDSDFTLARWKWADETDARIDHTGWYTDEHGDADKIRGLVVLLPHGCFLAGWSMGENMISFVEREIYTDETEAAYAADSLAEYAAEKERENEEG